MDSRQHLDPVVGNWYRSHGQLFEVVATDEDEQLIEIQHADGDVEEMDFEDWTARTRAGSLHTAEPPENSGLATDHEHEHDYNAGYVQSTMQEMHGLRANAIDDLDLFE
jgi:hypothetical protein